MTPEDIRGLQNPEFFAAEEISDLFEAIDQVNTSKKHKARLAEFVGMAVNTTLEQVASLLEEEEAL